MLERNKKPECAVIPFALLFFCLFSMQAMEKKDDKTEKKQKSPEILTAIAEGLALLGGLYGYQAKEAISTEIKRRKIKGLLSDLEQGNATVVKSFLEKHPEYIHAYSDDRKSYYYKKDLLECACLRDYSKHNSELIRFLVAKGLQAKKWPLYNALDKKIDADIIELFLASPEIDLKNSDSILTNGDVWKTSHLGYALLKKYYDVVPFFLKKRSELKDEIACSFQEENLMPLQYFIWSKEQVDDGMVYAIKTFLEYDTDPLMQVDAKNGNTILQFVAQASPCEKIIEHCKALFVANKKDKKIMATMLLLRQNKQCILSMVPQRLMVHMLTFLPKARLCSALKHKNVAQKTAQQICLDRADNAGSMQEKERFIEASKMLCFN